ncbi:MAG: peptidoglycan DD-metalloendopeptidase family protein [Magnetococcus sp. YQC-3]
MSKRRMALFWKNCRSPHYVIPLEPRPLLARREGVFRVRRFTLILVAIFLLTLFMAQQALDASTRRYVNASDYLTWLLRGEEARDTGEKKRSAPGSVWLASLPKMVNPGEDAALRMDFGISRAVIEQVQSGDTLFSVMQRHGVARKTALEAARAGNATAKRHKVGNMIRPLQLGRLLKLTFDPDNHLTSLLYSIDDTRTLHVTRQEDGQFVTRIDTSSQQASTEKPASPSLPTAPSRTAENRSSSPLTTPLQVQDLLSGSARQIRDTVRPGDLLTTLLARHGVSQATASQVVAATKPVYNLARTIKSGHDVRLGMDKEGQLTGVAYSMNPDTMLWVVRQGNGPQFKSHIQKKQFESRLKQVAGTIREDDSLFLAGKSVGLSHTMVSKLANLFEWDIDFAQDIHAGDQFRVVYEAKYYQGRRERDGEIVAAEFVNQGRVLQVFRYQDPAGNVGYYDAKGQSIRKMFIRAPVDFTRISSLFSKQRTHPIYGYTRAHKGVDYAAPHGTPVRAAADGKITFIGTKGDYGQFITIRHNDTYSTAYAHLSGFTRGLQVGSRVRQGEVVGRVGSTGSSTGPHLHYEVLVHDSQVNPLSIQQVTANPISAKYAEDFRQSTGRLLAQLRGEANRVAALPNRSTSED